MLNQRYVIFRMCVLAGAIACMLGGCISSSKRENTSSCPRTVATDLLPEPSEGLEQRQAFAPNQAEYNEQLLQEAIRNWSKAIKAHPRCAENYRERGWEYSNAGQFDKALEDLTRAIAIDPKSSDGFCKRAWVHISREEYDASVRDSTRAIALDRTNSSAYEARANAYGSLGKEALAAKDQEWLHKN